jgi:hypothetical protein
VWKLNIPTSVSSRWWRSQSIDFIDPAPEPRWVIWLGWCELWMAWDLQTGEPLEATPALAEKWRHDRARASDDDDQVARRCRHGHALPRQVALAGESASSSRRNSPTISSAAAKRRRRRATSRRG